MNSWQKMKFSKIFKKSLIQQKREHPHKVHGEYPTATVSFKTVSQYYQRRFSMHNFFSKFLKVIKRDGLLICVIRAVRVCGFMLRVVVLRIIFPWRVPGSDLRRWVSIFAILPFRRRHMEVTLLRSEDRASEPSLFLIETALAGCRAAIAERVSADARLIKMNGAHAAQITQWAGANIWPGEHYRLLAGLVRVTQAKQVIEIGTFHGVGTLSLLDGLPAGGKVTTYDIIAWDQFSETVLKRADFLSDRLVQVVGDLQDDEFFESQRQLFENAGLIFMDAAKDGNMERVFLRQFAKCRFKKRVLLVVDDIRLWNMLDIWDEIIWPKLDITGFGHYTGTGLVELPRAGNAVS